MAPFCRRHKNLSGGGAKDNLKDIIAMAEADQEDAYKRLPARSDYKLLPVVTRGGPDSGEMRGFVPRTCSGKRQLYYAATQFRD